jgi:hypothetical protein
LGDDRLPQKIGSTLRTKFAFIVIGVTGVVAASLIVIPSLLSSLGGESAKDAIRNSAEYRQIDVFYEAARQEGLTLTLCMGLGTFESIVRTYITEDLGYTNSTADAPDMQAAIKLLFEDKC